MEKEFFDINRIMEMLPHRYPILLVDRMLEMKKGESARSLKNVTFNEPHFNGHFPGAPVMPGVLIIEAMAQTAAIVVVDYLGEKAKGQLVYFMSIDDAKFRKPVMPGDQMIIEVHKTQSKRNVWKFSGNALVDGNKVAEANFMAMILEKED